MSYQRLFSPYWHLAGSMLVALTLLMGSCATIAAKPSGGSTQPLTNAGAQHLSATALVQIGNQQILLEVASTPEQQALGLMYRDRLPDDRGMVFPILSPRPVSFWMKNVPVPLDMVFIYQGRIRAIIAQVPPCQSDPCPIYGPKNQIVDQVIELRSGRAAELGLSVGDAIVIKPLSR
ncbi:MAG: DUF192 domain-containing protein [Cyanobacteria bacterium REEB459]|nr:DUF192 domain-containing protein [Cyanobacteria bacterium REEB459]